MAKLTILEINKALAEEPQEEIIDDTTYWELDSWENYKNPPEPEPSCYDDPFYDQWWPEDYYDYEICED